MELISLFIFVLEDSSSMTSSSSAVNFNKYFTIDVLSGSLSALSVVDAYLFLIVPLQYCEDDLVRPLLY